MRIIITEKIEVELHIIKFRKKKNQKEFLEDLDSKEIKKIK